MWDREEIMILMKELFGLNREQIEAQLGLPSVNCFLCKEPLTHADRMAEEIETVGSHRVHSGCRQDAMGELVEQSPITTPSVRRG